jgi:hypothetical protein
MPNLDNALESGLDLDAEVAAAAWEDQLADQLANVISLSDENGSATEGRAKMTMNNFYLSSH